jgi:hypothetical protein
MGFQLYWKDDGKGPPEKEEKEALCVQLLRQGAAFLLAVFLRVRDLQSLYGREFMGAYLQWGELAMP